MQRLLSRPHRAEGLGGLLRFVPRPLRRTVESIACRGAIMFNDVLDREQATRLVSDLSACQFLFQCAHGRPSLVPLVRLLAPGTKGPAAMQARPGKNPVGDQRGEQVGWDWDAFAAE